MKNNWLDNIGKKKFQVGGPGDPVTKTYTDKAEFDKANQAYNDSLIEHTYGEKQYNNKLLMSKQDGVPVVDIPLSTLTYGNVASPITVAEFLNAPQTRNKNNLPYQVLNTSTGITGRYKKPIIKPEYKEPQVSQPDYHGTNDAHLDKRQQNWVLARYRMPQAKINIDNPISTPAIKVPELKVNTMGSEKYVPFSGSGYGNPNIPQGYWDKGMGNKEIQLQTGGRTLTPEQQKLGYFKYDDAQLNFPGKGIRTVVPTGKPIEVTDKNGIQILTDAPIQVEGDFTERKLYQTGSSLNTVTPPVEDNPQHWLDVDNVVQERSRVNQVRKNIVNVAEQALDPAQQSTILNYQLPETINGKRASYCSTRSCEIEKAAGVTTAKDTNLFGRNVKAGSKMPIIPGTQSWVANADSLGYKKVDNFQAGDRVFQIREGNTPGHSLIYSGKDKIYYDDPGSGKNYRKQNASWIFNDPQYQPQPYRYVGNTPALEQQTNTNVPYIPPIQVTGIENKMQTGGRVKYQTGTAGRDNTSVSIVGPKLQLDPNLVTQLQQEQAAIKAKQVREELAKNQTFVSTPGVKFPQSFQQKLDVEKAQIWKEGKAERDKINNQVSNVGLGLGLAGATALTAGYFPAVASAIGTGLSLASVGAGIQDVKQAYDYSKDPSKTKLDVAKKLGMAAVEFLPTKYALKGLDGLKYFQGAKTAQLPQFSRVHVNKMTQPTTKVGAAFESFKNLTRPAASKFGNAVSYPLASPAARSLEGAFTPWKGGWINPVNHSVYDIMKGISATSALNNTYTTTIPSINTAIKDSSPENIGKAGLNILSDASSLVAPFDRKISQGFTWLSNKTPGFKSLLNDDDVGAGLAAKFMGQRIIKGITKDGIEKDANMILSDKKQTGGWLG